MYLKEDRINRNNKKKYYDLFNIYCIYHLIINIINQIGFFFKQMDRQISFQNLNIENE